MIRPEFSGVVDDLYDAALGFRAALEAAKSRMERSEGLNDHELDARRHVETMLAQLVAPEDWVKIIREMLKSTL